MVEQKVYDDLPIYKIRRECDSRKKNVKVVHRNLLFPLLQNVPREAEVSKPLMDKVVPVASKSDESKFWESDNELDFSLEDYTQEPQGPVTRAKARQLAQANAVMFDYFND